MLFEEVNSMWTEGRLAQAKAARLPGVCERTFRRYLARLREEEGDGIEALRDRRLSRASHRAVPVDEVMRMVDRYRTRYAGWNVRHFDAAGMTMQAGAQTRRRPDMRELSGGQQSRPGLPHPRPQPAGAIPAALVSDS